MKIDHIIYQLCALGGAEENLTTLAELQVAQGHEVAVCLQKAVEPENEYAQRLHAAGIIIVQWPMWMSRLSGDWATKQQFVQRVVNGLSPLILLLSWFLMALRRQPVEQIRASVSGRLRVWLGKMIYPNQQEFLLDLLLGWRHWSHRADILHLHSYSGALGSVLEWAQRHGVPTVYEETGTPNREAGFWHLSAAKFDLATVVVAVSQTTADELQSTYRVTGPIEVVPPIVALRSEWLQTIRPARADDSAIRVLTIARLAEEKGLTYLIEAARAVVAAHPNVRFTLHGEGHLRPKLQAQIDQAHLQDYVCLAGYFEREDRPQVMTSADIFVLPSITEGLPVSVVEAMAWGLPIVATTVGGTPEIIEDGVNGLLCPSKDANRLAQCILRMVEDKSLRHRLSAAAHQSYEQGNFQPGAVARRFETIYRAALNGRFADRVKQPSHPTLEMTLEKEHQSIFQVDR